MEKFLGTNYDSEKTYQMLDYETYAQEEKEWITNFCDTKISIDNYSDPDLLIRTGGNFRISNFMLWQIAYSEIYITNTFWPEFGKNDLIDALKSYNQRDRRFGDINVKK